MKFFIILIVVIVIVYFLLRRRPIFKGLSLLQLQRYITYASESLDDGGNIEIEPEGFTGPIRIEKKTYKSRPDSIILSIRSGFHSRDSIVSVSKALTKEGIDHKFAYTKKQHLPRRLFVPLRIDSKMVSSAATHIIRTIYKAIGAGHINTFSIACWGPYKKGLLEADGEIIKTPFFYHAGYVTGRILRIITGAFSPKKDI